MIRYVEIERFKTFQEKVHIDLGHPAVLIGPNNAGKTSVIQALSLWSQGVSSWYAKKGESQRKESLERVSAGINRLNILDVPVAETRFFWNATKVRKGAAYVEIIINVGIELNGSTFDCRMIFTRRDSEVIYCKPCPETVTQDELLSYAAQLRFHLLYPMSGIMSGVSAESEEPLLQDGRINVFLGQGQTAQVLRNICYKVVEQDELNKTSDWDEVVKWIKRIFMVQLDKPYINDARGSLVMRYREEQVDMPLDISLAGRGLQQILLILAYLYWHKGSILLVDEPDAHLEILRQRQVYEILKHVARDNGCQVVIATHSEVILDDAIETNLTMLLNGKAVNLATEQDVKLALRSFGVEHYYKAKVQPRILYVEGRSDIEMLRALAKRLDHKAAIEALSDRLNCFYIRDTAPEDTLETRMDRISGALEDYRKHFYTLQKFVPELRGFAIFDSDNKSKDDSTEKGLAICHWKRYELENYFITPKTLMRYVRARVGNDEGDLFAQSLSDEFKKSLDSVLLEEVFEKNATALTEFYRMSSNLQETFLSKHKMSLIAEEAFQRFAEVRQTKPLLNKGDFYELVGFYPVENIVKEVKEKLDLLAEYLG